MFCTYINDTFTECNGNVAFSSTVFQTAESLTPDQRAEFSVYAIEEDLPALAQHHRHIEQWTYRVEGDAVIRTWAQRPIPEEERAQRLAKNVDSLWHAADAYVSGQISGVAIGLLTLGLLQQLPKALAVTTWSSSVWDAYYIRKAAMTYDGVVDTDFSTFGTMPYSVPELRDELGL